MTEDQELDDEIIELTEIVDDSLSRDLGKESFDGEVMELDDVESGDEDFQNVPSLESDGGVDLSKVSSDRVEAALERVIEKKFAGKIETILFEVIEKMIEKEIKEIKASLQKDLDQIGSD
ncbi:hypothetical protein [Desulfospira joergensenii]|uniref:hypothetical protein n=1 Tax=Desulfospira joergensenii TaxID=53329 RepID=UPI0003B43CB0|nr:hypothetical protein [Desulfospira joergensenii]